MTDAIPPRDSEIPLSASCKAGRYRALKMIGLSLLAITTIAGAAVLYLLRCEPPHWKAYQAFLRDTPPAQLQRLAAEVQKRLESLVLLADDAILSGETRLLAVSGEVDVEHYRPVFKTLHLSPEEVNAWATEQFREWMTYRGYEMPAELTSPMVAIDNGRLLASFKYESPVWNQVFTVGFRTRFFDDGRAQLQLAEVRAGNLPLPGGNIGAYIRSKAPDTDSARRVSQWLEKLDRVEFKPSMKVGSDHKVTVVGYEVGKDGLHLALKIERRYPPKQPKQLFASVPTDGQR